MPVVISMKDGTQHRLDRHLHLEQVTTKINDTRGKGKLIEFETDRTPTGQMVWIDPDEVQSVISDRYSY